MNDVKDSNEEKANTTRPCRREHTSLGLVQFGFHAKIAHSADETLLQRRSENFESRSPRVNSDIWKRPPPDFRYVVYDPKPPKRNTVDSQQPWLYGTIPGQREKVTRQRSTTTLMPLTVQQRPFTCPNFITHFRIPRPFTAKKLFVKDGVYPAGQYIPPKLHDFRQYPPIKSLGLDEFETSYEKDPRNLLFKSEHLDTLHGLALGPPERDLIPGPQMASQLPTKPKWESKLILEKTNWPQRYEAFTRYRKLYRNPYSAFMERVDHELTSKWSQEKEQFELAVLQTNS